MGQEDQDRQVPLGPEAFLDLQGPKGRMALMGPQERLDLWDLLEDPDYLASMELRGCLASRGRRETLVCQDSPDPRDFGGTGEVQGAQGWPGRWARRENPL